MSDPTSPFGMDPDALRDAPLFRELQRVMASSSGPVNWELAKQVAIATAVEAGADPDPTDADREGLVQAVRVAELHVAGFTGLEPPGDVIDVQAVRRAGWVLANVEGLRGLLEPAAARMGEALGRAMRDQLPEEAGAMGGLLTQLGPLLQGTQVGQVLGFLAQRVLGQYDVAVPRADGGALLFVVPNLAAFERDWSLDPTEFRTLVALHEVTHRFEFARDWARPRFVELVDDFLSTLTIDVDRIQERLATIDPADPESFQRALAGEDDDGMFGAVLDDEQRLKLGRIQAFMAAAEGYADHVMHAVGATLLSTFAQIDEAMRRHREDERADPVFERLLGVDMKREQYATGRAFCDAVVELTNESALARMWDGPDALPSLPELDEPRLWLARTV
ncbi:MAG TPA: zinc-dependent metalloprotease [Actinomycetota bacterium]|nr:zinc-dependent metalloprotease [Actinomycetota bacterium]